MNSRYLATLVLVLSLLVCGCDEESPAAETTEKVEEEEGGEDESSKKEEAAKTDKAETPVKPGEENIEPAQRKIHQYGRDLLTTRKRFYRDLKVLVKNPKMPMEVLKEEIGDLYDVYESRFLDHGRKIQSLAGDARGVILKVDNYITAEPMGITFWVETEANRLVSINPDLADLLLKSYSLPRCYDFDLLRRNDPGRAKKLGLIQD